VVEHPGVVADLSWLFQVQATGLVLEVDDSARWGWDGLVNGRVVPCCPQLPRNVVMTRRLRSWGGLAFLGS
jgi:hypothetical protein